MNNRSVEGYVFDIRKEKFIYAVIDISEGKISSIKPSSGNKLYYIIPGLIDAHVHIESSLMLPSRFGNAVIKNGTIAVMADPHEIANVLGIDGIELMAAEAKKTPVKIFLGAPSCVPATTFETSGATIDAPEIKKLFETGLCYHLSEMMNFPGAVHHDPQVMEKIRIAKECNRPVDGHAPGLLGKDLLQYASLGITTDHECTKLEEAAEKIKAGMQIIIREGSAAKDFDALIPLLESNPGEVMFCTDDCHPDDLLKGHINTLVKKAIKKGIPFNKIIKAASVNPVEHYKIPVGLLREGDPADFIVIDSPENFHVLETWINGEKVFSENTHLPSPPAVDVKNNFKALPVDPEDLKVLFPETAKEMQIIRVFDGSLFTAREWTKPAVVKGEVLPDLPKDVLKLAVVNRYEPQKPQIAFVKGFGLKAGAIASSIAHDSHNLIAIGTSDTELAHVLNVLIENKGGLAAVNQNAVSILSLPYAGLMSGQPVEVLAEEYSKLNKLAHNDGSALKAPFMTLSFLSLLVIPELKLGDKGLFDVSTFSFTSLFR